MTSQEEIARALKALEKLDRKRAYDADFQRRRKAAADRVIGLEAEVKRLTADNTALHQEIIDLHQSHHLNNLNQMTKDLDTADRTIAQLESKVATLQTKLDMATSALGECDGISDHLSDARRTVRRQSLEIEALKAKLQPPTAPRQKRRKAHY